MVDAGEVEEASKELMPKDSPGVAFSCRTFLRYAGPGWLMSLAYLDPGNLESDLQNGAYTGYNLLWALLMCTFAGLILQILAARLGTVTGRDLASTCRERYPRNTSLALWVMTEVAIIGSDVQEVIGSAIALNILLGWPLWAGTLFTGLDTFTFMAIHYLGKRILEFFIFALIMLMLVCFFANFSMLPPAPSDMLAGFAFSCPDYAVLQLVGTVGAVIMPHNIYLHSSLVLSRAVEEGDDEHKHQANKYNVVDSSLALTISFLINAALMVSFANGFFVEDCARAGSSPLACVPGDANCTQEGCMACISNQGLSGKCAEIGLADGGDALELLLGEKGQLGRKFFALGVLAAGQASTMTGTFAGQYVMEGFLDWKVAIWVRTLITRSVALGPAVLVAMLTADSPNLNNDVNQWLNILQSVQLPFALLPVLHFNADPAVMGSFVLGKGWQVLCWGLAVTVIGVNFYLMLDQMPPDSSWLAWTFVVAFFCVYLAFIRETIREDLRRMGRGVARWCGISSADFQQEAEAPLAS